MSMPWKEGAESAVRYEAPTITLYGELSALTESVLSVTGSDAKCTGKGIPVAGLPSGIVCKTAP